jgi:hypothetical protein
VGDLVGTRINILLHLSEGQAGETWKSSIKEMLFGISGNSKQT